MGTEISGDLYRTIDKKMMEIKRQMLQRDGYPFNPEELNAFLQRAIEGRWSDNLHWIEIDGIIYFTLISNGKTGEEWITHLEGKGLPVGNYAKSILRHESFKSTKAGTVHNVAVIKGELFSNNDRITKNIRAYAKNQKMTNLSAEVACLIYDNFTDKEVEGMGLVWIITMHDPIIDLGGGLSILGMDYCVNYRIDAFDNNPDNKWDCDGGFAFAIKKSFVV